MAQSTVPEDPRDQAAIRGAGEEIRALMVEAAGAGARLVQFPEGALVYPDKHVVAAGPDGTLTPVDGSGAAWDVLREEAQRIAALAGELSLWTVFGSLHPLTPPARPHNSLYVVSDEGQLVTRYDKRYLSNTELSYLYTPGRPEPTVFEVDGFRFGLAICIEAYFPELFAEYERLDVDCVLVSVMVDDPARATVAQAYGTLYNYWLGYAVPAQYAANAPSGIVAPGGRWLHRAPADNRPALAIAGVGDEDVGQRPHEVGIEEVLDLVPEKIRHAAMLPGQRRERRSITQSASGSLRRSAAVSPRRACRSAGVSARPGWGRRRVVQGGGRWPLGRHRRQPARPR
ncbi:hypothetical protein GCM10010495_65810 [Kitasatospora herbaricolor]|nr:hypothetical protein GCM10010495_65810 [Kitasatospora herbaricolor]